MTDQLFHIVQKEKMAPKSQQNRQCKRAFTQQNVHELYTAINCLVLLIKGR
jgi:hypothetical protein